MIRRSIHSVIVLLCAFYAAPSRPVCAQSAAPMAYDITTIKPHKPGDNASNWRSRSGSFEASNTQLKLMIATAYNVKSWLVIGLPPWAESARYDVQAKVSDPDPAALKAMTLVQTRAMIAELLKDRFGLQVHQETKEQPVFELTVLPDGPKFHESPSLPAPTDETPNPKRNATWSMGPGTFKAKDTGTSQLSETFSYEVERVIVDKTGLTGVYDLELKWTPEDRLKAAENGLAADAPPDIFTALKDQLGLKLTPAKAPIPTIVIDHIDPPAAN